MKKVLLLIVIGSVAIQPIAAQHFIQKIMDIFEFPVGKVDTNLYPNRFESRVVLAPVAIYEPATSLGLGVGAKFLFKFNGSGEETRTSNIPMSMIYTLRNQVILYSDYTIFSNQERYLFKGSLIYYKFPFSYYGIGSLTDEAQKTEIAFDRLLFEPLFLKRVIPDFFVGGGIRYNSVYNTRLNEDDGEFPKGTSLQNELGSTSVGLELAATYDSRGNVLNALQGNFLEFTHGVYGKALGSTHEFMLTKLNFRQYLRLSPHRLDALALEWYTRFSWGDTPPFELSELGGEELLRGFPDGRFRDRIALFAQGEYRWQTFDRIGMVFFAGVGEVMEKISDLDVGNLKYSLGAGLRLKIVESENLNIRFDYAFGLGPIKDNNFYLGLAEAF